MSIWAYRRQCFLQLNYEWQWQALVFKVRPAVILPKEICCPKAKLKHQREDRNAKVTNRTSLSLCHVSSYHDYLSSEIISFRYILHFLTNLSAKGKRNVLLAYSRPPNLFQIPFPHTATVSYFPSSHSHPEAMSACHLAAQERDK